VGARLEAELRHVTHVSALKRYRPTRVLTLCTARSRCGARPRPGATWIARARETRSPHPPAPAARSPRTEAADHLHQILLKADTGQRVIELNAADRAAVDTPCRALAGVDAPKSPPRARERLTTLVPSLRPSSTSHRSPAGEGGPTRRPTAPPSSP